MQRGEAYSDWGGGAVADDQQLEVKRFLRHFQFMPAFTQTPKIGLDLGRGATNLK